MCFHFLFLFHSHFPHFEDTHTSSSVFADTANLLIIQLFWSDDVFKILNPLIRIFKCRVQYFICIILTLSFSIIRFSSHFLLLSFIVLFSFSTFTNSLSFCLKYEYLEPGIFRSKFLFLISTLSCSTVKKVISNIDRQYISAHNSVHIITNRKLTVHIGYQ